MHSTHMRWMPGFRRSILHWVAVTAVTLMVGTPASAGEVVEFDEAEVYIEWNSTDTDYGIQFFWDSSGFTRMTVRNDDGRKALDVRTRRNVKQQGLTEGFFESVEPPSDEVSMEEFFARFPEGIYEFEGKGIEGERLEAETEGDPLPVEFYVVVVEKEDDDPILQVYEVILRPGQTSVWVPEEFLEPDTDYKLEVIAQEESGNRTIAETEDSFTTDAP